MKWISVKERLPEHGECVMVYGDKMVGSYYLLATFYEGLFIDLDEPELKQETITHWIPLPDPPKN